MFTIAAFGLTVENGCNIMEVCAPVALLCLLTAAHMTTVFRPSWYVRKGPAKGPEVSIPEQTNMSLRSILKQKIWI